MNVDRTEWLERDAHFVPSRVLAELLERFDRAFVGVAEIAFGADTRR